MKYLITIAYDGSKFWGLQKLKDKTTVQGVLEDALTNLNELPVHVKAAGRTDRGVHALNQKCHFEIDKKTNPYKLKFYLNNYTPKSIYIKDCISLDDKYFHARFSVKYKIYKYVINCGEYNPIQDNYQYNYNKPLDTKLMVAASNIFEGAHSFKAFVTGKHKTYDSIINHIYIDKLGDKIIIEIKGKAFYTYMVRNIVRILILAGEKNIKLSDIKRMLYEEKRVIEYSPAPASGLYLKEVIY